MEQFLHKRSESYQCYSLPCTKTLRSTTMQKFEVSIIFVQGYKCAGPSTKLIWCGTCLKRRISNRERIQCGKNDLIKTSNTLKILFIEYFPLKEWGNLLNYLHFLIFFILGFWCHVSFNRRLSPSKSYRYHVFPSSWFWGILEMWGHFDITKYWEQYKITF